MDRRTEPLSRPSAWLAIGLTLSAGMLRLLAPIPNLAPVGALGLYAGGRLRSWQAFALPLLVMAATDAVRAGLGLQAFGSWTPFVYGSFLLYVVLGRWLCRRDSVLGIGSASLLGSIQFFAITNLGVWLTGQVEYPYTLQGLLECYTKALPFFGGTVLGDLFYTTVLFGVHILAARLVLAPKARLAS